MLFHTVVGELEMHPLLLIGAEVPHQCVIRAKHLTSLGFNMLVPTATITHLFISAVFVSIPYTCIFLLQHSPFIFTPSSLFFLQSPTLLSDPSFHTYSYLCSQEPPFCNLSVPHYQPLPASMLSSQSFHICFDIAKSL